MGKDNAGRSEPLLTRYLIYRTDDDGTTLSLEGEQLARSSDAALRQFFNEPPSAETEGHYAAISENYRRIKHVHATVRTTLSDAKQDEPEPIQAAPEPETLPV